ncbi:hypothetical protein Pan216_36920 [Planctomycetes bacterium Pan216]|uniref:Uncharacterized protein n=1 Tax=Kolteria novifilia TaxID=2527975 RepID=A0A518B779_9BACT|nr:hypothetical protein Pan216_36920 [Planctomycetes bacterium Pan216]
MADPKRPRKPREVERDVRNLLAAPLDVDELKEKLDSLVEEPAFNGLTWIWGPNLYERDRVRFRPFILRHFATFLIDHRWNWRRVRWKGSVAESLDAWLGRVDDEDDVELFRRLIAWKLERRVGWGIDHGQIQTELLRRYGRARTRAERAVVLAKFDIWFGLDESAAMELYEIDSEASRAFISRHLASTWAWGSERRVLWEQFAELAKSRGDDDLAFQLYRRQVSAKRWTEDVLRLCDTVHVPEDLVEELSKRHPEGWGLDLGKTVHQIVLKRGRESFPYVIPRLKTIWSPWVWGRPGYAELLKLAKARDWIDLWAALIRVCAKPDEFNKEVRRLLQDHVMAEAEIQQRLLALVGVAREWNFPGLGLAQVHQLDDTTACAIYDRFPELLRGPFRLHLQVGWNAAFDGLLERLLDHEEEELIDFLASRYVTRAWFGKGVDRALERLSDYYERLREEKKDFARRAAAVLNHLPSYSIWSYDALIEKSRLARLLFERAAGDYLDDARAMSDLVEAADIHVQAFAYRALGRDDPRAKAIAGENLELLLGTLLRTLRRRTRLPAFAALRNAANSPENARRVLQRAREALDLPDKHYPKERLVGLIGQILHDWPELRGAGERPVIFGAAS